MLVTPDSIAHLLSQADIEAEIEGVDLKSFQDPTFFARFEATVRVQRVLRSKNRVADTLTITGPGGEVGPTGVLISGYPRPHVGKTYRAHLKSNLDGTYSIVGFDHGLTPLSVSRQYSRNRTDGSNGEGEGAFLYWAQDFFPVPYHVSVKSFIDYPDFVSAIDESFRTWRTPDYSKIEFLPMGCTTTDKNENDGVNTIIMIHKNWAFDTSAIAITRNFYVSGDSPRSGLILDSDILLNGVNHSFTTTGESGKHDVQNIITHEAGHFLGFGHEVAPTDPNAVMYAVASPGETKKRTLQTSEESALTDAYGGFAQKNNMSGEFCSVPAGIIGCGAVHNAPINYAGILFPLLIVLTSFALARKVSA